MIRRQSTWNVLGALVLLLLMPGRAGVAFAQTHRIEEGAHVAPFALPDIDGVERRVDPTRAPFTVIMFIAAHQKRSERAVETMTTIVGDVARDVPEESGAAPAIVFVVARPVEAEVFPMTPRSGMSTQILVDSADALRGVLGVRVTPATILVDRAGTVAWSRAGHSFDYPIEARAAVERALAHPPTAEPGRPAAVGAAPSFSPIDRAARHVRIARVLAWRGDFAGALSEIDVAERLAPDEIALKLERARMLCLAGRFGEALVEARRTEPTTVDDRALRGLVAGWAHRELGNLDRARILLDESLALQPRSARALYELGRVLEAQGAAEEARDMYRRAIELRLADDPPS